MTGRPAVTRAAWILACAMAVAVPACRVAPGPSGRGVDEQVTVQVGAQTRTCAVHLPPGYDGIHPLPLVVLLHGNGGTGQGMVNGTGFGQLADREGFILACPDGISGRNRGWNVPFGAPVTDGPDEPVKQMDDVGFIRSLIDQLHTSYHTDPSRVFVCGHSAGACMAYRLAVELADRVAAAGIVNGILMAWLPGGEAASADVPRPAAPISLIHIRGGQDRLADSGRGMRYTKVLAWSVAQCIEHFANADGCTMPGTESRDAEHGVIRTLYTGGRNRTEVELVIVQNAAHPWPTEREGLSATEELWAFFSRHPKGL
jgi:polyhydroxybutyrate depolymerase